MHSNCVILTKDERITRSYVKWLLTVNFSRPKCFHNFVHVKFRFMWNSFVQKIAKIESKQMPTIFVFFQRLTHEKLVYIKSCISPLLVDETAEYNSGVFWRINWRINCFFCFVSSHTHSTVLNRTCFIDTMCFWLICVRMCLHTLSTFVLWFRYAFAYVL